MANIKNNNHLHAVIKLRHLKSASHDNWAMLSNTQNMVNSLIAEAQQLLNNYGSLGAKEQFESDIDLLAQNIAEVQQLLSDFHQFINGEKSIDLENSFQNFNATLERTNILFKSISAYPSPFEGNHNIQDWADIWNVIKSNMTIVQGIGESAYIKALMINNFNAEEVDVLTNEIAKHIPQSFNLLEADKYKMEYLQAIKEIEQESNAKDNLWDRFLNVLAGNLPFKQTPEERVMMRRWLDGEKGEL